MIHFDPATFADSKLNLYSLSFNKTLFELLDNGELTGTALTDIKQHITTYITSLSKTEEEKNTLLGMLENIPNDVEQYYSFLDELLERKRSKIEMIDRLFTENKQPIFPTRSIDLSQEELDEYIFEDFTSLDPILTQTTSFNIFKLTIFKRDGSPIVFIGEGPVSSSSESGVGRGSFGVLYGYFTKTLQRDQSEFNYVVKFARRSDDGTIDDGNERIANQALRAILREQKRRCDIIRGRVITSSSPKQFAILMPMMDGDIYKLDITNWNLKSRLKLLESVRSQMECIIKLNPPEVLKNHMQNTFKFAYVDLKPGNILFKRKANGELTYKLGDLGGIVEVDEKNTPGYFMSTFYVFLFEEKKGQPTPSQIMLDPQYPNRLIVKCMRYVFGILAHMLLKKTFSGARIYMNPHITVDVIERMNQEIVDHYGVDYSDLMYDPYTVTRFSMYN